MNEQEPLGPRLEVISKGKLVRKLAVHEGAIHIGRAPGLDVRFDDNRVSRWHARVEHHADGSCYLVDTSTHHMTFLNGSRVGESRPVPLRDGDTIRVADHELIFRNEAQILPQNRERDSTVLETLADLSSHYLAERSHRPAQAFRAMLDLNKALGGGGNLKDMLRRALDSLMQLFDSADCGLIVTAEPDGRLPVRAIVSRRGPLLKPALGRSILDRVLFQGEAMLVEDMQTEGWFSGRKNAKSLFRTALCVPLPGHDGKPVGMVLVGGRGDQGGRFNGEDLELLAALAWSLGVTVENHGLLRERAAWGAAREIQRALLPRERPEVPGYTFWECYRPALEVGGDIYDYISVPQGDEADERRWAICVGDVTGKGMAAALMSAAVSPEVRHAVRSGAPPADVLTRVNRHVYEGGFDGRFVTMVLVELDPREHRLTLANAGHEAPVVRRAAGTAQRLALPTSGAPLGVFPNEVYQPITLSLEPGEVFVLHSDGLNDAWNRAGARFGSDGVERTLAQAPAGVSLAGEALLQAVTEHAAGRPLFDDLTIVCFGRENT